MTRRTAVRSGIALAAFYVAMAAATATWAPGRLRPLFDGFGSHPGVYNWVNPPREFAEGNQRPESSETEMTFDTTGSLATSSGPNDGQALAALVPQAVKAHPSDTTARLTITPVDSTTLGALPAGLRPEGNAYRIGVAYDPSGTKVTALETPGTVGLTSAAPADTLLYSADGRTWAKKDSTTLATNNGLTGPLAATGYYLAASPGPLRAAAAGGGSGSGAVVLVIAGLAVPAALAWLLLSKRRPPPKSGKRPPVKDGTRPPQKVTKARPPKKRR